MTKPLMEPGMLSALWARLVGGTPATGKVPTLQADGTVQWETPSGAGVSDHGALSGLADNDHPQYAQTGHTHSRTITIGASFDGSGAALVPGSVCYVRVPVGCTITEATALADPAGSVVVDVWVDSYANYPPTNANSITASAPITISAAAKTNDTTLAGWDTAVAAGDVVAFHIDSCSAITRLQVQLKAGYSA